MSSSALIHKAADELADPMSYGNDILDAFGRIVGEWQLRPADIPEETED